MSGYVEPPLQFQSKREDLLTRDRKHTVEAICYVGYTIAHWHVDRLAPYIMKSIFMLVTVIILNTRYGRQTSPGLRGWRRAEAGNPWTKVLYIMNVRRHRRHHGPGSLPHD